MKREEFEKVKKTLKRGDNLSIHYRSNWRGGDGRPHNHRDGKWAYGVFEGIMHDSIMLENREYHISYKAIKTIEIRDVVKDE